MEWGGVIRSGEGLLGVGRGYFTSLQISSFY